MLLPLVGAAMLGANPLDRSGPAETPIPTERSTPAPGSVVESFAGRSLLTSKVTRGASTLTVTASADVPTQWTANCGGASDEYVLHMTLDGRSPGQAACTESASEEPLMGYVLDRRFRTGQHTLQLWLTSPGGAEVEEAPEAAVLAVGVYRLPQPVTTVAGVDIYRQESVTAQEWRYATSTQTDSGERRLISTHRSDGPFLAQIVAPEVDPQRISILVDGEAVDPDPILSGPSYLDPFADGRHTVELRLRGGAGAQIGVVWRELDP